MKRRWKIAIGIGSILGVAVLAPIVYVEGGCRSPIDGFGPGASYQSIVPPAERRAEARTWLTYPEWHIVYSADSLGRQLVAGRPSGYSYWQDIKGFWSSYCLLNRATRGSGEAGDAKVMIYTIGISFSAEMLVKAFYENTFGRLAEWIGGWHSADDRYAAQVQQQYGAFMHQTPWYRFPFGDAFKGLWRTREKRGRFRHWERRFALSAEYGVKTGYAKLIGAASGATLGRDELTLTFVARADPAAIAAIDPRLKVLRGAGEGRIVVQAPRYAEFSALLAKLAAKRVEIVEIAGNDDIFATFLVRGDPPRDPAVGTVLLSQPLGDRAGWRRVGVSTKVPRLLPLIIRMRVAGNMLEHVYDY